MTDPNRFSRDELEKYILNMPNELAVMIREIKDRMTGQTTYDLRERNAAMVKAVREIWLDLMEQLPRGLLGGRSAGQVFDDAMSARVALYATLQEPDGHGTGGTIAPQMVTNSVFEDAKQLVRIAAETQLGLGVNAEQLAAWVQQWVGVDVSA